MTRYIFTLIVMCLLTPSTSLGESPTSDNSTLIRYYEELRADWVKIFPNNNRNAGRARAAAAGFEKGIDRKSEPALELPDLD